MVDIHSDEYIIGQNIRKYRKQKGWSQKDLSDAVDIDRANISGIENGERGVINCVMLKRFPCRCQGTGQLRLRHRTHHYLPLLRAAQPGCGGQRLQAHHRIHDGTGRLRIRSGR